jgi:iron complex transport system substrate-binding protein
VQLSAEYIVSANPDLIVLADTRCCGQSRAKVAERPGWGTITAVKKGAIAVIDDSIASRWGPRLVNFVNAVASALKTTAK